MARVARKDKTWRVKSHLLLGNSPSPKRKRGSMTNLANLFWFGFFALLYFAQGMDMCIWERWKQIKRKTSFLEAQLDSFHCPDLAYLVFTGTTTYRTSIAAAKSNPEFYPCINTFRHLVDKTHFLHSVIIQIQESMGESCALQGKKTFHATKRRRIWNSGLTDTAFIRSQYCNTGNCNPPPFFWYCFCKCWLCLICNLKINNIFV